MNNLRKFLKCSLVEKNAFKDHGAMTSVRVGDSLRSCLLRF